jgi:hypothetical protein
VRALSLSVFLGAAVARAQTEPSAPPIIPTEEPAPIPTTVTPANPPLPPEAPVQYADPTYTQRCFAVPAQVWIPVPSSGRYYAVSASSSAPLANFHSSAPVGTPTGTASSSNTSGSGGSGSGGGGMDGKALLIIAVVVVAALPVVVYALDTDAPVAVEQRFHCPSFGIDFMGGVELGDRFGTAGAGTGRFTFGYGYFGSDFQLDFSSSTFRSYAGHLMLRIGPKMHIEPNVAVGFRSMSFGGATRNGVEFGVPHRYVFWREGLRQFSLELRPTLMVSFAGNVDAGLEAALIIPIVEPLHLRAGGRVQSFGADIIGGFNAGLSLSL